MTTLNLWLRDGAETADRIDLDRLTPRARALAEAIATGPARGRGRDAVACLPRQVIGDGTVADAVRRVLDAPVGSPLNASVVVWGSWSAYPADSAMDPHDYLEEQARRIPGAYIPVGQLHTPATAAQDAVDDHGITRAEVLDLLRRRGVSVAPDTWSSYVARGRAPQPVRHVGRTPLWDRQAILRWVETRPGQGARTDLRREIGRAQ